MAPAVIKDLSLFVELFAYTIFGFSLALIGLASNTHGHVASFFLGLVGVHLESNLETNLQTPEQHGRRTRSGGDVSGGDTSAEPAADVVASATNGLAAALNLPLWAVYGDLDHDAMASIPYAQPTMFIFMLLTTIVLINLLIAMFSETYTRVQAAAAKEHRLEKTARTYLYRNVMLALPPPLNAPYILCTLLSGIQKVEVSAARAAHEAALEREAEQGALRGDGVETSSHRYLEAFLKSMQRESERSLESMVTAVHEQTTGAMAYSMRALGETCRGLESEMKDLKAQVKEQLGCKGAVVVNAYFDEGDGDRAADHVPALARRPSSSPALEQRRRPSVVERSARAEDSARSQPGGSQPSSTTSSRRTSFFSPRRLLGGDL
jgi:hypothetical protein